MRRRSLLWGTSWIGFYTAVNFVVKIARGLVVPKMLTPAVYGLWSSLSVMLGYTRYADLGVQQQLAKRLPYQLAKERSTGYWNLASRGITWTACVTIAVSTTLVVVSFLYSGADSWFYRPAFALLALVVVAQNARFLLTTILTTLQEFRDVAVSSGATDILALILAIIGLLTIGVMGLVWAFVLAELTGALYCLYRLRRLGMPRPAWQLRGATKLIREGLLLLGVAFLEQIMMTIDQLFLLRFYPKEKYGVYALGLFIVSTLLAISGIFLTAQSRILELWGNEQREQSWQMIETNVALFFLCAAFCVAFFIPLTDFMIVFYLKRYAGGLAVFVLMPAIALVRGPVILLRTHFLAHNKERRLMAFQVCGLLVTAALDGLIIWQQWGLVYIVLASSVGYLLTGTMMFLDYEKGRLAINRAKYVMFIASLLGIVGIYLFYRNRVTAPGSIRYVMESLGVSFAYLAIIAGAFWKYRRAWIAHLRDFVSGAQIPWLSGIAGKLRRQMVG